MENLRLGVSAVRHDMRREETVEEAEKNTELGRQTPKRKAAGSNPVRDASALSRKIFYEIFRVSSNKKEASLMNCKKNRAFI